MNNIEPQQIALAFSAISVVLWLYVFAVVGAAAVQWRWRQFRVLMFLSVVMLVLSGVSLYTCLR